MATINKSNSNLNSSGKKSGKTPGKHPETKSSKSKIWKDDEKIRYGIVGLGHIAQNSVIPAFKNASDNSKLTALISNTPEKLKKLGKSYGVEALYNYSQFEECIEKEGLDAVYIALPNSMHREFALRAMRAGCHVLCEKPLCVNSYECRQLYQEARRNSVYLMVAYRLHFDEANMEAVRLIKDKKIGEPKIFSSVFGCQVNKNNIRLESNLGGGVLYDIGIYQINAARYLFQEDPVRAVGNITLGEDERFDEVAGSATGIMMFKNNKIAQFTCSFAAAESSYYEVFGTKGSIKLENAFDYEMPMKLTVKVGEKSTSKKFPKRDQFAAELAYFSGCILSGTEPEPSAKDAQADLEIIEAIISSSLKGIQLPLQITPTKRKPDINQVIVKPASVKKPVLVKVAPPTN